MYYLQSRYYDPEICRFINADSTDYLGATGTLLSYNLFAYCENDGVNFVDETGFTHIYSGYVPWTEPNDDQYFYNKNEKVKISDKLNWGVWGGAKSVAKLLYPDGAKFYEHFRSNTGRILYYDYTKAYKEDALIKANVDSLIKLIKTWACLFKGKKNEYYYMSSDLINSSASTMNWQLAIGDHSIGIRARLYYSSKNKKYTMNYTIYAYDRYNFDKTDGNGNTKTFYGIKDEYNARFVVIGMAKFFTSIGLMEGKITWKG